MWRGIEAHPAGRDPRDAWIFAQRICGVCTTVHAIVSVRAIENALALEVPLNAQYIRNMIIAAHGIHDHIVHFYQLSALDWVDIVSALKADLEGGGEHRADVRLAGNRAYEFRKVQRKLQGFVASGQLGVFGSGYWGHPAMKLPPEINLLAVVHYMQALDYQRRANQIVGILGSKTPHIQNLAVGGVSNPDQPGEPVDLTLERLYKVKALIDQTGDFVNQVYLLDVAAIGALYADWTGYGAGVTTYLSVPDMPLDTKSTQPALPGGYIPNGDIGAFADLRLPGPLLRDRGERQARLVPIRSAAASLRGQDRPRVRRLRGRRQVLLGEGTDLLRRARAGRPARQRPGDVASGHEPTKRHLGR